MLIIPFPLERIVSRSGQGCRIRRIKRIKPLPALGKTTHNDSLPCRGSPEFEISLACFSICPVNMRSTTRSTVGYGGQRSQMRIYSRRDVTHKLRHIGHIEGMHHPVV
ncbi:hypothetical protein SDC9_167165 [bioreactor metagenome]|uniref:Uncharacterized protein n=1 Tax=bioreactor metagenome TaxID=1076179 RepID=A0A645G784_9ZZZZ